MLYLLRIAHLMAVVLLGTWMGQALGLHVMALLPDFAVTPGGVLTTDVLQLGLIFGLIFGMAKLFRAAFKDL